LQKSLKELGTHAVAPERIKQIREEIRVLDLLPNDSQCGEDVELVQQCLEPLKIRVADHESF